MASDLNFVQFIVDQIKNIGLIRYKKMFGEYALYCNDKVVALICDNELFVKPTKAGRLFIGNVVNKAPYVGAKPYFHIDEQIDNSSYISKLILLTEENLPKLKVKKEIGE